MKKYVHVLLFCLLLAAACDDEKECPLTPDTRSENPAGRLYVPNQADQTMYVYDTESLMRIDSFDMPIAEPHFVTFDHSLEYYYVVGRQPGGQLAKYRASNDSLVTVVTVEGAVFPTACALSANDDTLYLTDFTNDAGHFHRYNVTGDNFVWIDSVLQAGRQTHDISSSPDGKYVVSAGYSSDDITIVDTETGDLLPLTIDSGQQVFNPESNNYGPYGIQIDLTGSMAIIACRKGADQIRLIDIKNKTILDSILIPASNTPNPATNGPTYLALSPDNNILFVTSNQDNSLYVIRLSTREVLKKIDFSVPNSFGVTISDDGTRVYATCVSGRPAQGMVYIIDGNTFEKRDSLLVGSEPFGIAWRPVN